MLAFLLYALSPYDITITQSRYLTIANKWKAIGVKIYYVDGHNQLREL